MGYIISKLKIQNLAYISDNKPIEFDIGNTNLLVLSGQNGYGKTTVFNAVELLFTGEIDHLLSVENRQSSVNIVASLAHNKNEDIVISAKLVDSDNNKIHIVRCFDHINDFNSVIRFEGETISQIELYEKLHFSKNLFLTGMYISQSKSLAFLEKKYKERKTLIAELIDINKENERLNKTKSVFDELNSLIEEKKKEFIDKKKNVEKGIERAKLNTTFLQDSNFVDIKYTRLFEEEYDFDKEIIDTTKEFKHYKETLDNLAAFLDDYEAFTILMDNRRVSEAIEISELVYMKIYYEKCIEEIIQSMDLIKNIKGAIEYKTELNADNLSINSTVFKSIGINTDDEELICRKLNEIKEYNKNLQATENAAIEIQQSRNQLLNHYRDCVKTGVFHSNTCPFCGSEKQDILVAFNNTENTIRLFLDANGKAVEHLKAELETNFKEIVIPKLDKFIKHYERLYQNYKLLSNCKDINSSRLESILNELDIHFNSASVDVVKLNDFKMEYERVKGLLIQKMRPEEKKLESERVEIYKAIYDQYYQSQKPNHTSTEIEKKKLYIATIYNSESQRELQKLMKEQEIFEEKEALFLEKSENLTRSFSTLLDKSKKAYQDYQTELVNAIRLPVLIYSGKIIQNFPLGLGINANVSSNQIVFEPMDKESTDAINLLSTGQLNGLAIAIELAIRKVYGEKCKLDFFMIDDPLQSIDDISAISLVDLLSDFGITQTIVSTHEDRSANLLNYKFTHKGLIPKRLNMKNEYLKYSAEDQEQISE